MRAVNEKIAAVKRTDAVAWEVLVVLGIVLVLTNFLDWRQAACTGMLLAAVRLVPRRIQRLGPPGEVDDMSASKKAEA